MGRVAGKVGGGIGGAATEALAREGAAVSAPTATAGGRGYRCSDSRWGAGTASALDVRDRMAVDAAVATVVREFGRLDIVLESAGISHRLNFLDADAETWDRIIAVTLSGMFHVG
jgi:NAD(P)-dependent dehydrogenase (short-subunit alcohol dehydrogenase family)